MDFLNVVIFTGKGLTRDRYHTDGSNPPDAASCSRSRGPPIETIANVFKGDGTLED
jgi:hypothetical protein